VTSIVEMEHSHHSVLIKWAMAMLALAALLALEASDIYIYVS